MKKKDIEDAIIKIRDKSGAPNPVDVAIRCSCCNKTMGYRRRHCVCDECRCHSIEGDPVEYSKKHGGWIFWEETWADFQGPYESEEKARQALEEYCKKYLGG